MMTLGFEAAFEGIVVESDDATALSAACNLLQCVGSVQAMIERRSFATNSISRHDEAVLRECRSAQARLVEHMRARCKRLIGASIPEERRIAQIFDRELQFRGASS